ncbi:MAG: GMC family oxidoreductase [Hyphomonadaceae bacterium]
MADFDVIIVGSGMSGGWAAKEFSEKGMKTLVLERGRDVEKGVDYTGENTAPWDWPGRDTITPQMRADNPIQSQCYAFRESTQNFFAKDADNPYSVEEGTEFTYIRGDQVGGRSLLWARQTYRWSEMDFNSNKRDGHGVDWPIRYNDIAPWYDHVEKFVGVSGSAEGLPQLPDGHFQPPMQLNIVEKDIKAGLEAAFPDRKLIIGRAAHLTEPTQEQLELGRGSCQFRNQCQRGCSFGAYFSSVSATLPAASRTNNMTLVSDTQVERIVYDPATRKATGVQTVNRKTGARQEYSARIIFMCASTFGTVQILLNSANETFQTGFANGSGTLGRYIMDHHHRSGATGKYAHHNDKYYKGRRPNGLYIPRFRNLERDDQYFLRGYAFQGRANRPSWESTSYKRGIGAEYKNSLRTPAGWDVGLTGFGETLPHVDNRVTLHPTKTDKHGMPQIHIDAKLRENEIRMREDMATTAAEMLVAGGCVDVKPYTRDTVLGLGIHEMGGARMGRDPSTSVLNAHNQCHDVDNVFVTDGACMSSSACQNPSLTYMALTARAVDFAVTQMKQGKL